MSARRIGLLGGTFDPIHNGHTDAAHATDAAIGFDELLVIPSNVPPHRPQPAASPFHRFAMAALVVNGVPRWRVSDREMRDDGRSYTAATLQRLHAEGFGAGELYFIIGADAFVEIESWWQYPAILEMAHFAVVSRPGLRVTDLPQRLPALRDRMVNASGRGQAYGRPSLVLVDAPTADVSSTAIRERLAAGGSIEGMVAPAVAGHIRQHGLYTRLEPAAGSGGTPLHPAAGRLHG